MAPASTNPVTVTSVLEQIFQDVGISMLAAAAPAWLAGLLSFPIIGPILSSAITWAANWMISNGVIEIKIGIIAFMSTEAQAKWASELTVLQQVQAAGNTLTPAQQAEFDAALQQLVENHPGVVNA